MNFISIKSNISLTTKISELKDIQIEEFDNDINEKLSDFMKFVADDILSISQDKDTGVMLRYREPFLEIGLVNHYPFISGVLRLNVDITKEMTSSILHDSLDNHKEAIFDIDNSNRFFKQIEWVDQLFSFKGRLNTYFSKHTFNIHRDSKTTQFSIFSINDYGTSQLSVDLKTPYFSIHFTDEFIYVVFNDNNRFTIYNNCDFDVKEIQRMFLFHYKMQYKEEYDNMDDFTILLEMKTI